MLSRRSLFKWLGCGVASMVGIRGPEAVSEAISGHEVDMDTVVVDKTRCTGYYWIAGEPGIYSLEDGEPI